MIDEPAVAPTARQQWQSVLLAALCSVLFLRDALLPGRALVPHPPEFYDVYRDEAIARGTYDQHEVARGNLSMGDKYGQSLCWDRVLQDRLRDGEIPLWTRDIGGGASFVPQMAQVYEPINLLLFVLPSAEWYGWWYFVHQVLFGWLCYRFLRRIGCGHAAAMLGVVGAVLGLWTQCKVHHNVILTAALPLWPMLSATHALVRGTPRLATVGALAIWTGISWLSGFAVVSLQVSYLTVGFTLLLAAGNERGRRLRPLAWVAAGMALGGMLSMAQMAPVLFASAASSRGGAIDAAALSARALEWDHALTAAWPDLLSWAGDRFYPVGGDGTPTLQTRIPWSQLVLLARPEVDGNFFQNWVETSFAIGVPAFAFAALAFGARERRRLVWFFAGAAVFALGTATATQPFAWLAQRLPGIAAADLRRLLFVVAQATVVLAALGADAFARGARRRPALAVLAAIALVSAGALAWLSTREARSTFVDGVAAMIAADNDHPAVAAAGGDARAIAAGIRNVAHEGEAENNLAMLTTTAVRTLLVATIALVALCLRRRNAGIAVATAVTAAELLHAGLGPVQTVRSERITEPPAVLAPVLAATDPATGLRARLQRLAPADERSVSTLLMPNIPGFLGVEDLAAYNPLPPRRMKDFFLALEPDREGKRSVAHGDAGIGAFHDERSLQHPLAELLGVRFVLTDREIALPGFADRTPAWTGRFRLYEREAPMPRATFVREVDLEVDPARRLELLRDPTRDVRSRIVLEDPDAPTPAAGAGGETAPSAGVDVVVHDDERVEVRVRTSHDGYLRLADPWDPGWRATVDGEPARVYAADHYLRAVHLTAGDHQVAFAFDAPRTRWPRWTSLIALLASVALIVGGRRHRHAVS